MDLLKHIEKFKKNNCIINENEKIFSYNDIINECKLIRSTIKTDKKKNLVFVLAENCEEFIFTYISFLNTKFSQMLVDPKIDDLLLSKLIDNYQPDFIFHRSNKFLNLKHYSEIYSLGNFKISKINFSKKFKINDNLALLLSTSGSTGSKKFAKISFSNLEDNTKNIIRYLKIRPNHLTITTMPAYYTYGLSIINSHLYSGGSILISNLNIFQKKFWKLIKERKVNSFGGVPYFYEMLKKLNFNKIKLPKLKYFTQAGGKLDKKIKKYFINYAKRNKKKFIMMYGQVEATSRISYLSFKHAHRKIDSVGKAIPGGKVFLENNKQKYGEILYKGKNIFMGYSESIEDLKKDETKVILRTGDFGKIDKDGFIYITGRKKREVKLYGNRVNLDEVEVLLRNKNYDCYCVGKSNKIIIFNISKMTQADEILAHISKITKLNKNSFKINTLSEIPLNSSGKISYKTLSDLA